MKMPTTDVATSAPINDTGKKLSTRQDKQLASHARHRLASIYWDSAGMSERYEECLQQHYYPHSLPSYPWIPNQRCGSWYLPPSFTTTPVYFKSTDGHTNTWNVSLKRLNLHLLGHPSGCYLVDASVRKLVPDSLSRTLPIWACVMNRIVLKYREDLLGMDQMYPEGYDEDSWDVDLHTPAGIVAKDEHAQILEVIPDRVKALYESQAIVKPQALIQQFVKPIRVVCWMSNRGNWIQAETSVEALVPSPNEWDKYQAIIACNPSTYRTHKPNTKNHLQSMDFWPTNTTDTTKDHGFYYTPGAADDHECWARKITPTLFWQHKGALVNPDLSEEDLYELMDRISGTCVAEEEQSAQHDYAHQIGQLPVWIGSRRAGRPPDCWDFFDAILNVTHEEYPGIGKDHYYLQLPVQEGKRDKTELERWMAVGLVFLTQHLRMGRRILVHCNQGKDRSVAVVLALILLVCRRRRKQDKDDGSNSPMLYPLQLRDDFAHWKLRELWRENGDCDGDKDCSPQFYQQSGLRLQLVNKLLSPPQDVTGRDRFLRWVHKQVSRSEKHHSTTPSEFQPLATKETIRIGLQWIKQDREVADPSRATLQKLNRFFMSSAIYRHTEEGPEHKPRK